MIYIRDTSRDSNRYQAFVLAILYFSHLSLPVISLTSHSDFDFCHIGLLQFMMLYRLRVFVAMVTQCYECYKWINRYMNKCV